MKAGPYVLGAPKLNHGLPLWRFPDPVHGTARNGLKSPSPLPSCLALPSGLVPLCIQDQHEKRMTASDACVTVHRTASNNVLQTMGSRALQATRLTEAGV